MINSGKDPCLIEQKFWFSDPVLLCEINIRTQTAVKNNIAVVISHI